MELKSYAKLNLSLIVKGRREDGFHELDMLIQNIDLCDIITISKNEGEIRVRCDNETLPRGEGNLVYKAAKLMKEYFKLGCGFDIEIEKKIPIAAGLGGGSSNAATVMKAIIDLCDIKVKQCELDKIALELGTEVVYFLRSGFCRVRGKGEIVDKLNVQPELQFLLINPNLGLSTKEVYTSLTEEDYSPSETNDEMLELLAGGGDFLSLMRNDLQEAAVRKIPVIQDIILDLQGRGFKKTMMSGSGTTVFAVIEKGADVDGALAYARDRGYQGYLCGIPKGV